VMHFVRENTVNDAHYTLHKPGKPADKREVNYLGCLSTVPSRLSPSFSNASSRNCCNR
jgi:hypothetical protein